ncbi:VOC family protein [Streptomyces sp. 549]|uniref:VOC family protein n=1 Tax=Streptomyces sp. 549 TaxID=3049076 RepID=UPI0024C3C6E3|nr:VOC family protein [Streptomyces sp. 549]MDK1474248.1 VOC family protein [Streptomyces sp. 549]
MTTNAPSAAGTPGPPAICPTLLYEDADAALKQLTEAFGFSTDAVYREDDGSIMHAELSQGGGVVMLGSAGGTGAFAEAMRGSGPSSVYVGGVPDVDAHHRRAAEQGAEILEPPTDRDYGSRDYLARDVGGNVWSFGTYLPAAGSA